MQLYLADVKDQRALARSLKTANKSPYKLNDQANPVYYTSQEADFMADKGNRVEPGEQKTEQQKSTLYLLMKIKTVSQIIMHQLEQKYLPQQVL